MKISSSAVKTGLASLALLAAAGAAVAADKDEPKFDAEKAAQAEWVLLNPQSGDEVEQGVAGQANIYCMFNAGSKKPIVFQVPEEYAAFGYPEGTPHDQITRKWLTLVCSTGEAYMGERDVVEAKQAEVWARMRKEARSGLPFGNSAPASTVVGPAGVVQPDGTVRVDPDMKVIEGSTDVAPEPAQP
ncbi:MAG: hypothetical protein LRY57_02560 [Alphaproteobacteria bacterium]|nr:hypothetical protein [Alphaproteobacteria bacterium]MCD8526295.1 hypothetical protein [Alphaproteobacteria bacterium]